MSPCGPAHSRIRSSERLHTAEAITVTWDRCAFAGTCRPTRHGPDSCPGGSGAPHPLKEEPSVHQCCLCRDPHIPGWGSGIRDRVAISWRPMQYLVLGGCTQLLVKKQINGRMEKTGSERQRARQKLRLVFPACKQVTRLIVASL